MGRLRETWNDAKSLSFIGPMWMLIWFLTCRSLIWPPFLTDLAGGVVAGVIYLAGAAPAFVVIYRARHILKAERASSVTEPAKDG
jgi:hypothetical protein